VGGKRRVDCARVVRSVRCVASTGIFFLSLFTSSIPGDAASFSPEVWFGDTPAFRSDKVGLRWNLLALRMAVRGADWAQTAEIARSSNRHYEMNPLLGRHPSVSQVNTYFILGTTTEVLATALWPEEYETALLVLQSIALAASAGLVIHNSSTGLKGAPVEDVFSVRMADDRLPALASPRFMFTFRW